MCGRQGIALGGHRDDSTSDDINKGKFRALVEFRIESGDNIDCIEVKAVCKKCYLATVLIQDELLEFMGSILTKILDDVKPNQFFGLEADEVADRAKKRVMQLVLSLLVAQLTMEFLSIAITRRT